MSEYYDEEAVRVRPPEDDGSEPLEYPELEDPELLNSKSILDEGYLTFKPGEEHSYMKRRI